MAFAQVGPQKDGAAAVRGGEFEGDGVLFVGRDFGGERADVENVGAVDALLFGFWSEGFCVCVVCELAAFLIGV